MYKFAILSTLLLTACGSLPGPSVPTQPGQSLQSARNAVSACARYAPKGGNNAVVGGYVAGVVLGGVLIGPIIVASNEKTIRANGEANAVDRCLAKQGFTRRDLTEAEMWALNNSGPNERIVLLNHLVGGGRIDTFGGA